MPPKVYAAVAPLRCHAAECPGLTAEVLALGCGPLPPLSDAAVWSASFAVEQD